MAARHPRTRSFAKTNDQDSAKEALNAMSLAIQSVNQATFQPDTLKLWSEFSNRLLNGLTIARRHLPGNIEQAARIATRSTEEAGRYLGLSSHTEMPKPVDPALAKSLEKLVGSYLPLAKALADDKAAEAQFAAREFAKQSDSFPRISEAEFLRENAETLASQSDIEQQRAIFQKMSNRLISLVRAHGLDQVGNAYVVHCPMAFDNTGGDWISSVPEVLNPYFGDAMLTCGSVTATLSLGDTPSMKTMDGMEHHNHGK